MSDSEDYDDAGYFFVEEAYTVADDLAEHTCPSPVPYDGDDDWDDHSRFTSYWNDLNYNSDSYYDQAKESIRSGTAKLRTKTAESKVTSTAKRRKVQHTSRSTSPILFSDDIPPVLWMSQAERYQMGTATKLQPGKATTILPNWRERFAVSSGFSPTSSSTKLPEVHDGDYDGEEEDIEEDDLYGLAAGPAAGLAVKNQSLDTNAVNETADSPAGLELDPTALQAVLRQHLQAAGINMQGMDEAQLLEFAARMFANESDADDIAGELANTILDQGEGEAEAGGFAGWVASQVQASEDDMVEDERDEDAQLPTPSQSSAHSSRNSNDGPQVSKLGKRKADEAADSAINHEMPRPKRAASSYRAATASSRARNVLPASSVAKGKKKIGNAAG